MIFEAQKSTPRLSIKAVILSNLAFWAVAVAGVIVTTILGLTGAGLIALHNSTTTTIDHVMSSPAMIGSWLMVGGVLAPMVGGYTAAKIAPDAKWLHAALSTSLWLVFAACCDLWGPADTDIPRWLDLMSSYAVPLPALAGAYLCQWRAMPPAVVAQA
jgi:hypothetical protein